LSTLGVGGAARWFVRARSLEEVAGADRFSAERGLELFVMAGGSNLVVADAGIDGCVLQVDLRGLQFAGDGEDVRVTAAAGEPWDGVVAATVGRGLQGLECLSGIPGSVGGTPIQNVGAYGQEVAGTIERVTVYDRVARGFATLEAHECEFAYRVSRFKGRDAGRFVVCGVTFRLRRGLPAPTYPDLLDYFRRADISSPGLHDVRSAVLAVRRRKGMVIDPADPDTRSVGSFFMNPGLPAAEADRIAAIAGSPPPVFPLAAGQIKVPAAWLIERAGFVKGMADGPVAISGKHPLAIVNRGGATARDVLRLATRIKRAVLDRFGVWLRPEPVFVGFGRDADLIFLQKAAD
jgi:UDP-N-acetylmuramate dehydrogenase